MIGSFVIYNNGGRRKIHASGKPSCKRATKQDG
jgi:hypothetical protein